MQGTPPGLLGNRQQGVNTVQGASGDRTPITGRWPSITTARKGGGQAGHSQDNRFFSAGFQIPQEPDQLRKVAVGGQNGFFIRNILLSKILAGVP